MTIVVDSSAFVAGLRARLQQIGKQHQVGVRNYADVAIVKAGSHIHSESGALVGRLVVEEHLDADPPHIVVGVDESDDEKPHAIFVEFGTELMSARPFMRPGLEEAKSEFRVNP